MKVIKVLILSVFLMGCGQINRSCAQWTGHSYECVDNIQYIQFPSGASVAYDEAGKVRTCRSEK